MSTRGNDLLPEVRRAQEELGGGSVERALELAVPLVGRTAEVLRDPAFLGLPADRRRDVVAAFCFARVTAILALESVGAAEAVPRIRAMAADALDVAGPGTDGWRVQAAAAEMLSRCGDGPGAHRAVRAAARLAPPDEDYVRQLAASVSSMYPGDAAD